MTSCHSEPSPPRAPHCRETPESALLAQALRGALPPGLQFSVAQIRADAAGAPRALEAHRARFPEEARLVKNAVPKRLFEFLAARELARQLLVEMGERAVEISRGSLGEPVWPAGIVGTVAHSNAMVVVAMGKTQDFAALGIDLEPNRPLPGDVAEHISLPGENDGAPASRALFVAKEAYYKAHCGLHRRLLDFSEVRVTWQPGGFVARELVAPANSIGPTSFAGTLAITAEWLAACCAIERS